MSGKMVVGGIQQGRVAGRVAVIQQALLDAGKRKHGDVLTLLQSNAGLVDYYTQNVPSNKKVKELRSAAADLNQANKNKVKAGHIADTIKAQTRMADTIN